MQFFSFRQRRSLMKMLCLQTFSLQLLALIIMKQCWEKILKSCYGTRISGGDVEQGLLKRPLGLWEHKEALYNATWLLGCLIQILAVINLAVNPTQLNKTGRTANYGLGIMLKINKNLNFALKVKLYDTWCSKLICMVALFVQEVPFIF